MKVQSCIYALLDKLELGGESPQTMRARCSAFRYCPDPLGIVPAEQLEKLEFGEQWLICKIPFSVALIFELIQKVKIFRRKTLVFCIEFNKQSFQLFTIP